MRRSIVITKPARLSLDKSRLKISQDGTDHFVPIEDLDLVILDHDAIEITGPVMGDMASRGVAIIVSDNKHLPCGYLLPFQNNVLMAQTLRGQIEASTPTKKKIWQSIIQEKIRAQARLLVDQTQSDHGLGVMAKNVASGDTTNREGYAASTYFPVLFGGDFERLRQTEVEFAEPNLSLINSMMNYGYAVIRASVARAIVAAGLHPALGVFHRHRNNPFALADDLMEPIRPLVDREVCAILAEGDLPEELNPPLKRRLVTLLTCEIYWNSARVPLDIALSSYASDVRQCLLGEKNRPRVPGV